jgi:hypothetical protein
MVLLLLILTCAPPPIVNEAILKVNNPPYFPSFAVGKPQRQAVWVDTPRIRICISTGVSLSRATQATRYWEGAGYRFGAITSDPFSTCMNPHAGEILITLPESGFSNHHMASTRLYTDSKTGDIVKVKIHILPKHARKERVLEHEIGHALGWTHYRQRYHIMHPTWHMGGYDRSGIRK